MPQFTKPVVMQRIDERTCEERARETIERMGYRVGIEIGKREKEVLYDLLLGEFENLEFSAYYDGMRHKD